MFRKGTVNMLVYLLVLLLLIVIPLGCSRGQAGAPPPNGDPGSVVGDPGNDEPASVPGDDENSEPEPAQQDKFGSSIGGWSYCAFKPGQFMKYSITSERGLEGWASIKVEPGENHNLDITLEGKWATDDVFSETATFKPGMTPIDFIYSLQDVMIVNAVISLFSLDHILLAQVTWEEGYRWEEGDKIIEVTETESYAGKDGMVMHFQNEHAFTGEIQKYIYVINFDFPLPLFLESPAANDTFYYELTEFDGI